LPTVTFDGQPLERN